MTGTNGAGKTCLARRLARTGYPVLHQNAVRLITGWQTRPGSETDARLREALCAPRLPAFKRSRSSRSRQRGARSTGLAPRARSGGPGRRIVPARSARPDPSVRYLPCEAGPRYPARGP
ncbi:hypothetical protein AADZ90_010270 [Aestuariibius sp. 2305UL40-4]|uniref:hypothetical protein n=1 Tax=Aestuariibius violaceus TaxID=3234132 RepID=UPI00345E4962